MRVFLVCTGSGSLKKRFRPVGIWSKVTRDQVKDDLHNVLTRMCRLNDFVDAISVGSYVSLNVIIEKQLTNDVNAKNRRKSE